MTHDQAKEMYDRFMRDVRSGDYNRLADMADVMADAPTDAEIAYLVAEGLDISLTEAIDRLGSVDADALRQEVLS